MFIGISVVGFSTESERPPLFLFTEHVPVVKKTDDKLAIKSDRINFDRLDVVKKRHKNFTWIDSSPLVLWGSQFKEGFFITRMRKGHLSFFSSEKKLVRYHHKW